MSSSSGQLVPPTGGANPVGMDESEDRKGGQKRKDPPLNFTGTSAGLKIKPVAMPTPFKKAASGDDLTALTL